MNLEQLRKQAKELLKGAKAGDDEAVRRLGGRAMATGGAAADAGRRSAGGDHPERDEREPGRHTIDALGPDFHGVSDGSPDGTLLHHAAWYGDGDAVRKLLVRGARVKRDPDGETPLEWAAWSSRHLQRFDLDYVPAAEELVEHGEEIEPRYLDIAVGPLREWLELHLPGEL